MGTAPGQPISATVRWAQEWQRLSWATTNQAMGHYLEGCADIALARTPLQALAALHKTHRGLLGHSTVALAEAARLWRKQNTELFASRVKHARTPQR